MAVIERDNSLIADAPAGEPVTAPKRSQQKTPAIMLSVIASYVLMALLALIAARIAWLFLEPLPVPAGDPVIAPQPGDASAAPIVVKSPFGAGIVALAPPADAAPDVAETDLNLTLRGVWSDEGSGSAIIELPDGRQKRFAEGEELIDGVSLEKVYPDQVTIIRNGTREALKFETKDASVAAPARVNRSPARRNTARNPSRGGASALNMATVLRIQPSTDRDGKRVIKLYPNRNREAFDKTGLKPGDVLVSINGSAPPSNPAALSSFLGNLRRQTSAAVVVERDGENASIQISLSDLQQ